MNLVERFLKRAEEAPGRTAIIEISGGLQTSISYGDLNLLSSRAAGFFRRIGLGEGDTALVFEGMSIKLYAILIGLWRIGAIAMFIDPSGGRRLLDASCRIGKPKAFIAISKAHLFRFVSSEISRIPKKVAIGPRFLLSSSWKSVASSEPCGNVVDVGYENSALYTFTSGSTGAPKATNRTHGVLLAQHDALVSSIELEAGEVDLATMPIFTLANLASGLTTVIPDCDLRRPGFIEARNVLRQINDLKPSRCVASPSFFMRLQEEAKAQGCQLPFKKIYTGGAPVFPKCFEALAKVAMEADIHVVYGSTEAEPISHIEIGEMSRDDVIRMESGGGLLVGKPTSCTALKIIEDRFGESLFELDADALKMMELGKDKVGEIIVSGSHVLTGYLNGVGDEENKIHVGDAVWHRTGDAGCLDEHGRLWLLGRCSSKIIIDRKAVYPFSIETAASMNKRIAWSAFMEHRGKRLLVIQLEDKESSVSLEELSLPQGLVEAIVFIDRIPLDKRHNAKIDYRALKSWLVNNA